MSLNYIYKASILDGEFPVSNECLPICHAWISMFDDLYNPYFSSWTHPSFHPRKHHGLVEVYFLGQPRVPNGSLSKIGHANVHSGFIDPDSFSAYPTMNFTLILGDIFLSIHSVIQWIISLDLFVSWKKFHRWSSVALRSCWKKITWTWPPWGDVWRIWDGYYGEKRRTISINIV